MAHYNPERKPQKRRIDLSIVVAVIGALGAIIAALVAKNYIVIDTNPGASHAGISSTPAAPSTSSSVPSNTSSGEVLPNTTRGEVLRKGRLTLTNGYCVDLDSTAPNWSVSSDCSTDGAINGKGDIRELTDDQGLYAPNSNNDFATLDPSQSATFATCNAATDYSTNIGTNSVIQGLRFCVRTTSGNFALMQVINARPDANGVGLTSATFKVTVWKGSANN